MATLLVRSHHSAKDVSAPPANESPHDADQGEHKEHRSQGECRHCSDHHTRLKRGVRSVRVALAGPERRWVLREKPHSARHADDRSQEEKQFRDLEEEPALHSTGSAAPFLN
jgi:hypothetical protein